MKYFIQETCILCAIKMSQEFGAAVRQLNQAMLPQVICILPNNLYLCILSTMTCVSEKYLIFKIR